MSFFESSKGTRGKRRSVGHAVSSFKGSSFSSISISCQLLRANGKSGKNMRQVLAQVSVLVWRRKRVWREEQTATVRVDESSWEVTNDKCAMLIIVNTSGRRSMGNSSPIITPFSRRKFTKHFNLPFRPVDSTLCIFDAIYGRGNAWNVHSTRE